MFFSFLHKEKHNGPTDAQCVALRLTGTVLSVTSDCTELAFSPNCAPQFSQALSGPRRGPLRPPFFNTSLIDTARFSPAHVTLHGIRLFGKHRFGKQSVYTDASLQIRTRHK